VDKELIASVEALFRVEEVDIPVEVIPAPTAVESDSEEAWRDFQDSQLAFERSFQESRFL
jgi:hypothetical protein